MTKSRATREYIELILKDLHDGECLKTCLEFYNIQSKSFYDLVHEDPQLSVAYLRAQSARAELLVEEIVDIADTEHDAQKARNRIDARKWYASKMTPHKYGDRIDLNVTSTVDIGLALKEARARISPQRYPDILVKSEVLEITDKSHETHAGYAPANIENDSVIKQSNDIDIFE